MFAAAGSAAMERKKAKEMSVFMDGASSESIGLCGSTTCERRVIECAAHLFYTDWYGSIAIVPVRCQLNYVPTGLQSMMNRRAAGLVVQESSTSIKPLSAPWNCSGDRAMRARPWPISLENLV